MSEMDTVRIEAVKTVYIVCTVSSIIRSYLDNQHLEKRNYANKLITTLERDRKITKEPARISQEQTTFYENLYSEKINLNDPNYQSALNEFLQERK